MLPLLLTTLALAQDLPPQAQALLDQARAANPVRVQFAIDHGAKFLPTTDNRSFYLIWYPAGVPEREHPLIVTLHGHDSWATDEFFLWQAEASRAGYGIVALQWWFGAGDSPSDYYLPVELHRELRAVLAGQGNREGTALLHGFSRGSANLYGVAALDRKSEDRYYALFLANSGGATPDFPPNMEITRGDYGLDIFNGTKWAMFCGGADPNPNRDGCPAMRRTAGWVEHFGGAVNLFLEDPDAGHGGFHQNPGYVLDVVSAFTAILAAKP